MQAHILILLTYAITILGNIISMFPTVSNTSPHFFVENGFNK